jgi:hypothetical protein
LPSHIMAVPHDVPTAEFVVVLHAGPVMQLTVPSLQLSEQAAPLLQVHVPLLQTSYCPHVTPSFAGVFVSVQAQVAVVDE